MEPRRIKFKVPVTSRVIEIEEPGIAAAEAVASEFDSSILSQEGQINSYNRALAALSVRSIDDKSIEEPEEVRKHLKLAAEWRRLVQAFNYISYASEIQPLIAEATKAVEDGAESMEFQLPSGKTVTMFPLTLDEEEQFDLNRKYTSREWLRRTHDKVAYSVRHVDGSPVDRETFNPRVEFPYFGDWVILRGIFSALNQTEDAPDFLDETQGSGPTTRKSPTLLGTRTSRSPNSSVEDPAHSKEKSSST